MWNLRHSQRETDAAGVQSRKPRRGERGAREDCTHIEVAIPDTMATTPTLETIPSSLASITNSHLTERQVVKH
ncbi:hypothetical protein MATL_G00243400 [Megalops atlanticus]|uniref:Uncharacterized protein n=1 Tax=Megalops atlanticus TaxID=7932 RepID=A0A9D3SVX3_MEGAT|nr:hypothetical protein MATL_G00243400 [Megalops atlanticus]